MVRHLAKEDVMEVTQKFLAYNAALVQKQVCHSKRLYSVRE